MQTDWLISHPIEIHPRSPAYMDRPRRQSKIRNKEGAKRALITSRVNPGKKPKERRQQPNSLFRFRKGLGTAQKQKKPRRAQKIPIRKRTTQGCPCTAFNPLLVKQKKSRHRTQHEAHKELRIFACLHVYIRVVY